MVQNGDTSAAPRRRKREPKFVCCICSVPYAGIGHDPAPIANKGECCDVCRLVSVLPERDAELASELV